MNLPALSLEDGDTFFLDNSRYEYIMRCMRSAEYAVVYKRVSAEAKQALKFGEAGHLAHKFRYKYYGAGPIPIEGQIKQFMILEKFFDNNPPPPVGDHRTVGFAQYVIETYNNYYKEEDFTILPTPAGIPVVEEGFAIPLGQVGDYKVVWKGRLDLGIVDSNSDIWTVDHKHVQMGGDYALQEYFTSNQLKGYTWALRHILGKKVKGAMINLLICRKITKTGKGVEFLRNKFEYDDDVLEEWQRNTLNLVSDFFHSHERGFFPMQTTQCVGKYGLCQFRDICTMAPMTRLQWLMSTGYQDDKFDPLHEDAINLDEIYKMPVPDNYKKIEMVDPKIEIESGVADIMKGLGL